MGLDVAVFGAVFLFGLVGFYRGAARQIAKLVAMVAGLIVAQLGSPLLAPHLPGSLGGVFIPQKTGATLLLFFATSTILTAALAVVLRGFFHGDNLQRKKMDRWFGLVLGSATASVIAYVALCGLASFQAHSAPAGWRPALLETSRTYNAARAHNAFYGKGLDAAEQLLASLQHSVATGKLLPSGSLASGRGATPSGSGIAALPGFSALTENPKFREILSRPHMQKTVQEGDPREVLKKLLEETHKDREAELERITRTQ
jgi:uncharacterized membrane protein required for colicin V production